MTQEKKSIEKDAKKEVQKPLKKKLPTNDYLVKGIIETSKKTYKKGDKISLTKEGYKFYRSKNKI